MDTLLLNGACCPNQVSNETLGRGSQIYPKDQVLFRIVRRNGDRLTRQLESTIRSAAGQNALQHLSTPAVITRRIGGHEVGFLTAYVERSKATSLDTYIVTNTILLKQIRAVFFIPTKFRVYAAILNETVANVAFERLQRGYAGSGVPVFDLTPALTQEAKVALANDEFVYWRDDSHWNGRGIAAAMGAVVKRVELSSQ